MSDHKILVTRQDYTSRRISEMTLCYARAGGSFSVCAAAAAAAAAAAGPLYVCVIAVCVCSGDYLCQCDDCLCQCADGFLTSVCVDGSLSVCA